MHQDNRFSATTQAPAHARLFSDACFAFCQPLLKQLDRLLDRRLVETFFALVLALVQQRGGKLLLSELGGFLDAPSHAAAGTKRLSRLLHSPKWLARVLDDFFWQQAETRLAALEEAAEAAFVIWDESVLEKSESLHLEGLCPVRSSKAARLKRIKPGFFNPPGGAPIIVPGFHCLGLLLLGFQGHPTLAHLTWWTTRGPAATDKRTVEWQLLAELARRWGRRVLHLWDRGFAGLPWLTLVQGYNLRFLIRWNKSYPLVDAHGDLRPAWHLLRGKPSQSHKQIYDARRRCWRRTGVCAVPVQDPVLRRPLWLIVSRFGPGKTPWYLLTNEPIATTNDLWRMVLAYARRWQIEMALRFEKCELALESPRVRTAETRSKVFGIVALVYAFLLSLLQPLFTAQCDWLLHYGCPRTGKWRHRVVTPLYRLRAALARLWLTHPPPLLQRLNSG
jgi:hypothetical protein